MYKLEFIEINESVPNPTFSFYRFVVLVHQNELIWHFSGRFGRIFPSDSDRSALFIYYFVFVFIINKSWKHHPVSSIPNSSYVGLHLSFKLPPCSKYPILAPSVRLGTILTLLIAIRSPS